MIAVGNGILTQKDIYEMITIPSKYSWNRKIPVVDSSALYLTKVEYLPDVLNNAIKNHDEQNDSNEKDENC